MPIRSPHGRSAAYRTLWAWPLRSPARLAFTAALVVAVAVGVTVAITLVSGGRADELPFAADDGGATTTSATRRPGVSDAGGAVTPTMLPPVPELTPEPLPLSAAPDEAIEVAARWAAAWVRPREGTSDQQWLAALRPTTSDEYFGVLSGVDPSNIPASRVTGEPRPVRVAARSVQVEVPTDALTLIVLVVETEDGWRVAGYDRD